MRKFDRHVKGMMLEQEADDLSVCHRRYEGRLGVSGGIGSCSL